MWCWDVNPNNSNNRYNCGGSWNNNDNNCKVDNRNNTDSKQVRMNLANNRNNNLGFRLVRSLSYSSVINVIRQFCRTGLFL
ncbi:MAG: hypothetical protein PUI24_00670 [Spirochaetales bacterium]|nr:hypothetical protein [Spirochaetales bacterium]